MTLEAQLLTDSSVRATDDGCEVDVRLPWYRSLPMSCLENVDLTVNGEQVEAQSVRVRYGDKDAALSELEGRVEDWWFVQDAVTLVAPLSQPLAVGDDAAVDVTLFTRIPYIMIGPEMALVQQTRVARKVVAR